MRSRRPPPCWETSKCGDRRVPSKTSPPRFVAPMRNPQSHAIDTTNMSLIGARHWGRCPTHQATTTLESHMLTAYFPIQWQQPGVLVPVRSGDSEERGCCCEEGRGGEGGCRAEVVAVPVRADARDGRERRGLQRDLGFRV
jgi:hypothetical protein